LDIDKIGEVVATEVEIMEAETIEVEDKIMVAGGAMGMLRLTQA